MDLSAIDLSAAGLRVQRRRMDVIASNLANVGATVAREDGSDVVPSEPVHRKLATVVEGPRGLPMIRVTEDGSPVDPLVEMVDLIAASRAYEANLTAVEVAKSMHQSTLRILG